MDPRGALLALARQLISGHRMLADLVRTTHVADMLGPSVPGVQELQAKLAETQSICYNEVLRSIAAAGMLFGDRGSRDIRAALHHNRRQASKRRFLGVRCPRLS